MRQGQGSKRSRGRSNGRRVSPQRNGSFDSNGPSIRIRGNAHQVHEKYLQMARDFSAAGDRVAAENMYQHAEHYFRILNAEKDKDEQQAARGRRNGGDQPRNDRRAEEVRDEDASDAEVTAESESARGDDQPSQPANNELPDFLTRDDAGEKPARRTSRRSNGRTRTRKQAADQNLAEGVDSNTAEPAAKPKAEAIVETVPEAVAVIDNGERAAGD